MAQAVDVSAEAVLDAALYGRIAELHAIAAAGGSFAVTDPETGDTALLKAAQSGSTEALLFVLDNGGGSLTDCNKAGWTVPLFAARDNVMATVQLVVDRCGAQGPWLDATTSEGETLALCAAESGCVPAFSHALDHTSCRVDDRDMSGGTAAMRCAMFGHVDLLLLIARRGGDMALRNRDGWTAAMIAHVNSQTAALEIILAHGGSLSPEDAAKSERSPDPQ